MHWENIVRLLSKETDQVAKNLIDFVKPKLNGLPEGFDAEFDKVFSEEQTLFLQTFGLHYFSGKVTTSKLGEDKERCKYHGYYLENKDFTAPRIGFLALEPFDKKGGKKVVMTLLTREDINQEKIRNLSVGIRNEGFLKKINGEYRKEADWFKYEKGYLGLKYQVLEIDPSNVGWETIGEKLSNLFEFYEPKSSEL